jgi:hypothetical protein
MRRMHARTAIAVIICGFTAASGSDLSGKKPLAGESTQRSSCGRHGTAVEFVPTPTDAATQAKGEEKLVLVLHVSGHFESPEFT